MSTKDYKRGMEAGAKPFEKKFSQTEADVRRIGDNMNQHLNGLRDSINLMVDDLTAIQKKELYNQNTPFDIKELSGPDKELLISGIFGLADSSSNITENQKTFIRSVKKYVGISSTDTIAMEELSSAIENIESLSAQKAILQVFMEFLFINKEDDSFLEEAMFTELFSDFNVNTKNRQTILDQIHMVYRLTGAEGIAEKYGYIPPKPKKKSAVEKPPTSRAEQKVKRGISYDELFDENRLILIEHRSDMFIDTPLDIEEGKEMTIQDKNLKVNALITVKGKLTLENCSIDVTAFGYNSNEEASISTYEYKPAIVIENGSIFMIDCEYKSKPISDEDYVNELNHEFTSSPRSDASINLKGQYKFHAENCYFYKIHNFIKGDGNSDNVLFKRCLIDNGYEIFISGLELIKMEQCTVKNHIGIFLNYINFPILSCCEFINDDNRYRTKVIYGGYSDGSDGSKIGIIDNCLFDHTGEGAEWLVWPSIENYVGIIKNCDFINAGTVRFQEISNPICGNIATDLLGAVAFTLLLAKEDGLKESAKVFMSKDFIGSSTPKEELNALLARGHCQVDSCSFHNMPNTSIENADIITKCTFSATDEFEVSGVLKPSSKNRSGVTGYIIANLKGNGTSITDCVFRNLAFKTRDFYYLIGHNKFDRKSYKMSRISNCTFENCNIKSETTELIAEYGASDDILSKTLKVADINNVKFIKCFPETSN